MSSPLKCKTRAFINGRGLGILRSRRCFRGKLKHITIICSLCLLFCSSTAHASPNTPERIVGLFCSIYVTPALGVTSLVGTLFLSSKYSPSTIRKKHESKTAYYLRQNHHALAQDIAVGGGEVLKDVSVTAGVNDEHYKVFTQLVRAQRRTLLKQLAQPSRRDECATRLVAMAHHANLSKRRD